MKKINITNFFVGSKFIRNWAKLIVNYFLRLNNVFQRHHAETKAAILSLMQTKVLKSFFFYSGMRTSYYREITLPYKNCLKKREVWYAEITKNLVILEFSVKYKIISKKRWKKHKIIFRKYEQINDLVGAKALFHINIERTQYILMINCPDCNEPNIWYKNKHESHVSWVSVMCASWPYVYCTIIKMDRNTNYKKKIK